MTLCREWIVHRYDSVTSTMDTAALLAGAGAADRTVVVSSEQTAGRGRGGRRWSAPKNSALLCTLILRPAVPAERLTTLPLVAGVAVAEAIERVTGISARLKWPNDVWLGDDADRQKVAGILVTSSLSVRARGVELALVGIGVNVTSSPEELPPGATSIAAASGVAVTPDRLFAVVLDRFDRGYAAFLAAAGSPSLAEWRARAAMLGESVIIEDVGRQRHGTFVGIDDDGALLLEEASGAIQRIVAGDLVRGPRADR